MKVESQPSIMKQLMIKLINHKVRLIVRNNKKVHAFLKLLLKYLRHFVVRMKFRMIIKIKQTNFKAFLED